MKANHWSVRYLAAAALVLAMSGCKSVRDAVDNNPDVRKGAVEKARSSCIEAANGNKGHTPEFEAKITSYCTCFGDKGIGKFTNSELMEIGVKGANHLSTEEKKKLDDAVNECKQVAGIE
jgi:hypothetical protein